MKKIFTLILAGCLIFALFACTQTKPEPTDTATEKSTETSTVVPVVETNTETATAAPTDTVTDTETSTKSSRKKETISTEGMRRYTTDVEHRILVCDIKNYSIIEMDCNKVEDLSQLTDPKCVVWEWKSQESTSAYKSKIKKGIDDAKFRHDDLTGQDVIIACSSSGWAGIINYATKELIFDVKVGNGPHSIELLPNGDFVVACAGSQEDGGDGCLRYYPRSVSASTSPANEVTLRGCHGVCWDPSLKELIADGYDEVYALKIGGYGTANIKMTRDEAHSYQFTSTQYCHDMVPVPGKKSTYYIATSTNVITYDAAKAKLGAVAEFSAKDTKGIAPFADGTTICCIVDKEGKPTQTWSMQTLTCFYHYITAGKVPASKLKGVKNLFTDREFYKVHTKTADYDG